jgi:PiT family inorganic phosphate transporter
VGVARGFNDTPKIAALGVVVMSASLGGRGSVVAFAVVAAAMSAGGLLAGGRVLQTLASKVTPMRFSDSLAASFTTASLVSMASFFGLPVSTTHVSTGAIVGAGVRRDPGGVQWKKVGEIVLSWLITLPVAALLAAAVSLALRWAH